MAQTAAGRGTDDMRSFSSKLFDSFEEKITASIQRHAAVLDASYPESKARSQCSLLLSEIREDIETSPLEVINSAFEPDRISSHYAHEICQEICDAV